MVFGTVAICGRAVMPNYESVFGSDLLEDWGGEWVGLVRERLGECVGRLGL